jgi:hypothetical protein
MLKLVWNFSISFEINAAYSLHRSCSISGVVGTRCHAIGQLPSRWSLAAIIHDLTRFLDVC